MVSPPSPRRRPQRKGLIAGHPRRAVALVILDMISRWEFPDGELLGQQAQRIAPRIAALKRRCTEARIPVIYANDNSGQWRSDFEHVVRASLESDGPGAAITRRLEPGNDDYFVLKPKHSAFFATPLEILLDHLKTWRLVVTGVTSDQCVSGTVNDALMRDFEVIVPRDCVATVTPSRNRRALAHFQQVFGIETPEGSRVRLDAR